MKDELEEKTMNLFLTTLDFSIFDTFSDEAKDKIYTFVINKHNNPITTIIFNHMKLPKEFPNVMLGPCSYYVLTIKDKIFYLFGDNHLEQCGKEEEEEICREFLFHKLIPPYLGRLDKIIDVFIEGMTHYRESIFEGTPSDRIRYENRLKRPFSYMIRFLFELLKCQYPHITEGKCEYKNLRIHRPDPRRLSSNCMDYEEEADPIGCLLSMIGNVNAGYGEKKELEESKRIIPQKIRNLKNLVRNKKDIPYPLFHMYIKKQIDAIHDVEVKNLLLNKLNEMNIKVLRILLQTSDNEIPKILTSTLEELDLYFLARCFRTFSGNKFGFPPVPCKYIVAWFGNTHIVNIVSILLGMNATLVCKKERNVGCKVERCLDYSQLSNPWFGDQLVNRGYFFNLF
jgi:hypothetical protein